MRSCELQDIWQAAVCLLAEEFGSSEQLSFVITLFYISIALAAAGGGRCAGRKTAVF